MGMLKQLLNQYLKTVILSMKKMMKNEDSITEAIP